MIRVNSKSLKLDAETEPVSVALRQLTERRVDHVRKTVLLTDEKALRRWFERFRALVLEKKRASGRHDVDRYLERATDKNVGRA